MKILFLALLAFGFIACAKNDSPVVTYYVAPSTNTQNLDDNLSDKNKSTPILTKELLQGMDTITQSATPTYVALVGKSIRENFIKAYREVGLDEIEAELAYLEYVSNRLEAPRTSSLFMKIFSPLFGAGAEKRLPASDVPTADTDTDALEFLKDIDRAYNTQMDKYWYLGLGNSVNSSIAFGKSIGYTEKIVSKIGAMVSGPKSAAAATLGTAAVAGAATASTSVLVSTAAVGAGAYAFDKAIGYLEDRAKTQSTRVAQEFIDREGDGFRNKMLTMIKVNPSLAREKMNAFIKEKADFLSKMEPQSTERILAQESLTDAALFIVSDQENQIEKLSGDISQAQDDIVKVSKTLTKFQKETARKMSEMKQTFDAALQETEAQLHDEINDTGKRIDLLDEFLYAKMTPAEQRQALEAGMMRNMSEAEYVKELEKVKRLEKRDKFIAQTGNILEQGSMLIGIAKEMGINPELLGKMEKGVAISQKAFGIYQQLSVEKLAAGNILTAASLAMSVIGHQKSAEDQRHEQIMGKFDIVFDHLKIIEQGLDRLYKGQQEIISKLDKLSNQLEDLKLEMNKQFDLTRDEIYINRSLMSEILNQQFTGCEVILRNYLPPNDGNITTDGGSYITVSDMIVKTSLKKIRASFRQEQYSNCREAMNRILLPYSKFSKTAPLLLQTAVTDSNDAQYAKYYQNTVLTLERYSNYEKIAPDRPFLFLTADNFLDYQSAKGNQNFPVAEKSFLKNLYDPMSVIKFAQLYLMVSPLAEIELFMNSSGRDLDEIRLMISQFKKGGLAELNQLEEIVTRAIIQETLFTGGAAMKALANNFLAITTSELDCKNDDVSTSPTCLLQNNRLLRKNMMKYFIRHTLREQKISLLQYKIAASTATYPERMQTIIGNGYKIQWQSDLQSWVLMIGRGKHSILEPFPTADELQDGAPLLITDAHQKLLLTLKQIHHARMDFDLLSSLKNEASAFFVKEKLKTAAIFD